MTSPAGSGADWSRRFAASAVALDSPVTPNDKVEGWLADRLAIHNYRVDRIPFADLKGWSFDPHDGNLGHESGKFFTVEGLRVDTDHPNGPWQQPVINQPEIGILGILVKEFDGVLHCLMQAKMEPGNVDTIQLSPTVQATRSNYTGVHRGRRVHYLDHFVEPGRSRVLSDSLQSEQGSWFLGKRNRNMIVEARGDVYDHDDFRWLTIGQIHRLLRLDNRINMDARSVLGCLPFASDEDGGQPRPAAHSTDEILTRLTDAKTRYDFRRRLTPLARIEGWRQDDVAIDRQDGRFFRIIAVSVSASNREVRSWTQPMLEPCAQGLVAFVTREVSGVPHILMRARLEAGLVDVVELSPTVQCTPAGLDGLPADQRPPYLDLVLSAPRSSIGYDVVLSEEGGRFHRAENRYLVVEAPNLPEEEPEDFVWVTPEQAMRLSRDSYRLTVQARTLLTAWRTMR